MGEILRLGAEPGLAHTGLAHTGLADTGLERVVSCPECGLPAEILDRFSLASTDGPVAHVALGCLGGHFFRLAVERLPAEVPLRARSPHRPRRR
jgi:hypothetical protein